MMCGIAFFTTKRIESVFERKKGPEEHGLYFTKRRRFYEERENEK